MVSLKVSFFAIVVKCIYECYPYALTNYIATNIKFVGGSFNLTI